MIYKHGTTIRSLMASTALLAAVSASSAFAQAVPIEQDAEASVDGAIDDTIVVTGSRIRGAAADSVPIVAIDQQRVLDRGYTSAADALNDLPSNAPVLNLADGSGEASGPGFQAPNLFNLGAGRTLTLLNGRRMVTSASGIGDPGGVGDAQVDANIIPLGLLQRV